MPALISTNENFFNPIETGLFWCPSDWGRRGGGGGEDSTNYKNFNYSYKNISGGGSNSKKPHQNFFVINYKSH